MMDWKPGKYLASWKPGEQVKLLKHLKTAAQKIWDFVDGAKKMVGLGSTESIESCDEYLQSVRKIIGVGYIVMKKQGVPDSVTRHLEDATRSIKEAERELNGRRH